MTAPADPADARRRAEEALRYDHDHANSPEVRRRLRGAVEALLAAGPEAKACVPEIAPNPAKGGPPLSIARVLQLAVAALHDEQHHSLAEEVRSVAVALAAPPPSDVMAATGEMGPARGYLAACARSVDNVRTGWPPSAEVREAAEAVCERLCGGAGEGYYRKVAPGLVADIEALRAALRSGQKGER